MTDAGEAFGQNMQQPAPDEFVGMQGHDGGLAGGSGGPAQEDVALAAFTGIVRLRACPENLRARIGIDHRLPFRLLPDSFQVVDLINPQGSGKPDQAVVRDPGLGIGGWADGEATRNGGLPTAVRDALCDS